MVRHTVKTVCIMTTSIYSREERNAIVNEMLAQLGGRGFMVMVGAKMPIYFERDNEVVLRMAIGKNCHIINRFEIAYNECEDLYELRFIRSRKNEDKIVKEYKSVCSDMLADLFEKETCMATMMPRIFMV